VLQATGLAEAIRLEGQAQAEVTKVRGIADADIIRAKGQAEANAMGVKAEAYQEYNQAAIIDKLLSGMPEIVRALAEPLTKVDSITVVSTGSDGNGSGTGVNKVTADVTSMIAQVPALFEALSGMKISDLLNQVPQIKAASQSQNGRSNGVAIAEPAEEATEPESKPGRAPES
jgi:flotillin